MNDTVRHHMKSLAKAVKQNGGTVVLIAIIVHHFGEKMGTSRRNRIMKKC